MSEPRAIVVKRWVCGGVYCTRSYAKRSTTQTHMETCWKVPENRACMTCKHFQAYEADYGDRDWFCAAGVPLEAGKAISGCNKWVDGTVRKVTP